MWCAIAVSTDADRDRALLSAAFCAADVTTTASAPGNTVATWPVVSHRTMYGGEPSAERTSVITPR
jgi:hypothetical protein